MIEYLFTFGHGYSTKGSYDTGAVHVEDGLTFTEQETVRFLIPPLKKWAEKAGINLSFYEGNMYANRNINEYKGYNVTEFHLDAPKGIGGHVIIDNDLNPDTQDMRLAKFIENTFETVGYVGPDGINKRDNLYNVNMAEQSGINFRLLELFFLSNDEDRNYFIHNLDAVAKGIIEATTGKAISGKVIATPNTAKKVVKSKSIDVLAKEVMAGVHGSGRDRRVALGNRFDAVQDRVNELVGNVRKVKAVYVDNRKFKLPTSGSYSETSHGRKYSAEVLVIQQALASIYYYLDKGAVNNGCDGYYGPKMISAVRRFQSVYTPSGVDGIVGENTLKALDEQAN